MTFWIRKPQIVRSINHATDVTVESPVTGRIQFKDNLEVQWKGDGDLTCSLHEKMTRKSILHKCAPRLLETAGGHVFPSMVVYVDFGVLYLDGWLVGLYVFVRIALLCG